MDQGFNKEAFKWKAEDIITLNGLVVKLAEDRAYPVFFTPLLKSPWERECENSQGQMGVWRKSLSLSANAFQNFSEKNASGSFSGAETQKWTADTGIFSSFCRFFKNLGRAFINKVSPLFHFNLDYSWPFGFVGFHLLLFEGCGYKDGYNFSVSPPLVWFAP
jgi:hypothetical protein